MVLSTLRGQERDGDAPWLGCVEEDIACGRGVGAGGAERGQFVSPNAATSEGNGLREPDIMGAGLAENLVDGNGGDCGFCCCGNGGGCVGHVGSLLT